MDSPPVTEHDRADEQPRRYGRRLFLATVLGGVSSLYWGKAAWDHVSGVVSPVANAVAPGVVPTGGWRIYTISGHMPVFDPSTWRLRIGGLVDKPVSLTYDELRALPRVDQVSTFHCVTGCTVNNVHWGGVRMHDVMLAYEMDGKPLPQEHGAPVRLIIPEMYGYKNVKWLGGINLVRKEQLGYWEQLGYDQDAWVGRSNGYGA